MSHKLCLPKKYRKVFQTKERGKTMKELVEIIVRKVPERLRRELKAKAAMEGQTMNDVILRLIVQYVNES